MRFSLFAFFFMAVLLAVGADKLRADLGNRSQYDGDGPGGDSFGSTKVPRHRIRRPEGWWRSKKLAVPVVAGIVVIALVPLIPRWPYGMARLSVPQFFTSASVDTISPGAVVATYPYPYYPANLSMLWQAESGFRFRTVSGYFIVPDKRGNGVFTPTASTIGPVLETFYLDAQSPPVAAATVSASRAELKRERVADVVAAPLGADPSGAVAFLSRVVGSSPQRTGGVYLWRTGWR